MYHMYWCVSVHCFSIELQIQLVQAYWSELFVIGLAQCSQVMNLSTILTAILNHLQTRLVNGKNTCTLAVPLVLH